MSLGSAPLGANPLGGAVPRPHDAEKTGEGIPLTATNVPESGEAPEVQLYKISFEKYKKGECNITGMDSINAQATLVALRDVGIFYTSRDDYSARSSQPVEVKHVSRDGEYAILYKGLVDEDVYEIKLKREQKEKKVDIRIFFTTLDAEKIFYVVAAKNTHYDTSKGEYEKRAKKKPHNRPFRGR